MQEVGHLGATLLTRHLLDRFILLIARVEGIRTMLEKQADNIYAVLVGAMVDRRSVIALQKAISERASKGGRPIANVGAVVDVSASLNQLSTASDIALRARHEQRRVSCNVAT